MRWGGEPGEPLVPLCTVQIGDKPICDEPATAIMGTRFTCACRGDGVGKLAVCDEHLYWALSAGWKCDCGAPCYHSEPVALP